jgi:hypothetical protein
VRYLFAGQFAERIQIIDGDHAAGTFIGEHRCQDCPDIGSAEVHRIAADSTGKTT